MNNDQWEQMWQYTFQSTWAEVSTLLPEILAALAILIVGYLVAVGAKKLIVHLSDKMQVDDAVRATGADRMVERTGYKLNTGRFLGTIVKWFILIIFFIFALDILGLNEATNFLTDVVLGYLPRVIVATIILFITFIVAQFVERVIVGSARAARFGSPQLLGKFAKIAIMVFGILAALNELLIATELVQMLFGGLVFAFSLALGLSFGLGGREAAARYIDSNTRGKGM